VRTLTLTPGTSSAGGEVRDRAAASRAGAEQPHALAREGEPDEQGVPDEPIERSRITIDAYVCRRLAFDDRDRAIGRHTQYRPRDETNLADALKPAIDALIGIVIVDDDAKHCRVEMPYIHQVDTFNDERIELNVEAR
jgi:hypothetical protein